MKIVIKKDSNNSPIGWEISGETPKEIRTVNTIRNLTFFGFDDTAIKYNGRTESTEDSAGTLHWIQKKHKKN
jgi:hypothetical protein